MITPMPIQEAVQALLTAPGAWIDLGLFTFAVTIVILAALPPRQAGLVPSRARSRRTHERR